MFLWFLFGQALADFSHEGQACCRSGCLLLDQPQTGRLEFLAQIANGLFIRILTRNIDNSRDGFVIFRKLVEILNDLGKRRRFSRFQDDGYSFGPAKIVDFEASIALMGEFGSGRWVEMPQADIGPLSHRTKP